MNPADGITLASMPHPEGRRKLRNPKIRKASLETIYIEIAESGRPVTPDMAAIERKRGCHCVGGLSVMGNRLTRSCDCATGL